MYFSTPINSTPTPSFKIKVKWFPNYSLEQIFNRKIVIIISFIFVEDR